MNSIKTIIIIFSFISFSTFVCKGEEYIIEVDSIKTTQDSAFISIHDKEATILTNMYTELLDIEKQIRLTHNTLVDLNFMSPSSERKIQQKIVELSDRLDNASVRLNSITDKDVKSEAKPYKVTVKDCKQKLSKCSSLLKKKSKK